MKPTHLIYHQPSWRLATRQVEGYVTRLGGHLGPVTFRLTNRQVQPFAVAPWHAEKLPSVPPILQVLRGDFFCLPFGNNTRPYAREKHPPHGETANAKWNCIKAKTYHTHLQLRTHARPGTVDKHVLLRPGETVVYQQHVVRGMSGPMNVGHHATLRLPDHDRSGLVACSGFAWGQVAPLPFESPAEGGYSSLRTGARFDSLQRVPAANGAWHDLSSYPARRGYEDLVMLVGRARGILAWTAVTVPQERYIWISLKDPRVLTNTVLWHSNGGRHYPPWNGRHVNVLGLEEVTSYFHYGLAESAARNPVTDRGGVTCLRLDPDRPLVVNYIMAVAAVPHGFDRVRSIVPTLDRLGVRISCERGTAIELPLDVSFLQAAALA